MNTNELRRGNWLYGKNPLGHIDYNKVYFQVDNIEEERINVWRVEGFSDESASEVEPIPLTAEILEKVGFKNIGGLHQLIFSEDKNGIVAFFTDLSLNNDTLGLEDAGMDMINIKIPAHLHQLQNLYFSLTGEELQISI